jgi:excisionase family DNA binding protein
MDSKFMTLKEVADYINLNENTIDHMAQKGDIPAQKVARQWRFDRAAIDTWMANRSSAARVVDQQLPPEATGIPESVTVSKALSPQRINMDLKASDKDGVLHELVALVIDPKEPRLAETLFNALKAREDLCSTCVNEGVASDPFWFMADIKPASTSARWTVNPCITSFCCALPTSASTCNCSRDWRVCSTTRSSALS